MRCLPSSLRFVTTIRMKCLYWRGDFISLAPRSGCCLFRFSVVHFFYKHITIVAFLPVWSAISQNESTLTHANHTTHLIPVSSLHDSLYFERDILPTPWTFIINRWQYTDINTRFSPVYTHAMWKFQEQYSSLDCNSKNLHIPPCIAFPVNFEWFAELPHGSLTNNSVCNLTLYLYWIFHVFRLFIYYICGKYKFTRLYYMCLVKKLNFYNIILKLSVIIN